MKHEAPPSSASALHNAFCVAGKPSLSCSVESAYWTPGRQESGLRLSVGLITTGPRRPRTEPSRRAARQDLLGELKTVLEKAVGQELPAQTRITHREGDGYVEITIPENTIGTIPFPASDTKTRYQRDVMAQEDAATASLEQARQESVTRAARAVGYNDDETFTGIGTKLQHTVVALLAREGLEVSASTHGLAGNRNRG